MVHTFQFEDNYYIYDVESGSFLKADKLMHLLVSEINGQKPDFSEYSEHEIAEAKAELDKAAEQGLLFAEQPKSAPISFTGEVKALCVHICHDCNLACSYCFAGGGTFCGGREIMDVKTGKAAIDFLLNKSGTRKNLEVDFFGGEPLLNLDAIKEIVAYARGLEGQTGKKFKFTVTTNALLLNDEITEYFNKEMDNVVISIDGRKSVHDDTRKTVGGKGSYDTVMKKAKAFRRLRGDKSYYIRGTFTSKNLDFTEDVLSIADNGFDQVSIEPVVLSDNDPLAIREQHIEAINKEYDKLAKEYIKRRQSDKTWFNFFHFMIDLKSSPCLKKKLTGCGAGTEYLAVTPNGDIYPCHQFAGEKDYRIGSVFESTLNEDIRSGFAGSNLLTKPHCQNCFAKYFCSGGCAANSIKYGGGIDLPHKTSCEMMKKRFEAALAVYAAENM